MSTDDENKDRDKDKDKDEDEDKAKDKASAPAEARPDFSDSEVEIARRPEWESAGREAPSASARERALATAIAAIPATRNRISSADQNQNRKSDPDKRRSNSGEKKEKRNDETMGSFSDIASPRSLHALQSPTPLLVEKLDARRRSQVMGLGMLAAVTLAAAFVLFLGRRSIDPPNPPHGDVTAHVRTEVNIGRARVVLEPNAHLVWASPENVNQSDGSIFYRVEPGSKAPFVVHTPVGDVTVVGTCFRVKVRGAAVPHDGDAPMNVTNLNKRDAKAAVVGAAGTIVALVAVYEGKVSVSHAGQTVQISAGESASLKGNTAPHRDEDGNAAERAFDDAAAGGEDDGALLDPMARANKNLVLSVSDYRARLERLDVQKRALEQELAEARAVAQAAGLDAGPALSPKNEISQDEWKELAKTGTIKMRIPCNWKGGWWPDKKKLDELGLGPDDAPTVQQASNRLYETSWAKMRPLCEKVGGPELADKLGLDGCPSFIFNYIKGTEKDAALESMRRVAEMRAGARPTPATLDDPQLGPIEKMFLILTGEQQAFEQDLAQSFGPEEAHRIVTSDSLCSWNAKWDGPGPRKNP